jgi:hypothetical protein
MSCTVALRVKKGHSINAIICDEKKYSIISSTEKANIVREYLSTNGLCYFNIDKKKSLLSALGDYDVALCLVDSEDYELAIRHLLFNETVLEAGIPPSPSTE